MQAMRKKMATSRGHGKGDRYRDWRHHNVAIFSSKLPAVSQRNLESDQMEHVLCLLATHNTTMP